MTISWLDNPSAIDPAFAGSATQKSRQIKPLFGDQGFSFKDFLDIINPLQHLPVVGSMFRNATGDTINPGARLIGGALYGGPAGFTIAAMNTQMAEETGADLGDRLMVSVGSTPAAAAPPAQVAPSAALRQYAEAAWRSNASDPFGYTDRGIA